MTIDIIYPVHNRLDYTQLTLPLAVLEAEQSKHDVKLWIIDDGSDEQTKQYIDDITEFAYCEYEWVEVSFGNSYDSINHVITYGDGTYIAKWDNDILYQVGATDILVQAIESNKLIGFLSPSVAGTGAHTYPINNPALAHQMEKVNHIGGIGLFRRAVFTTPIVGSTIPGEERFYGFTAYQYKSTAKKAISTAVHVIELDKHPLFSRLNQYTESEEGRNIIGQVDSLFNRMFV